MSQCCCMLTISQSEVGIIETCGKFSNIATPGLQCILPWSNVVSCVSLRLRERNCSIESKTKDNVFVLLDLTLQYQVIPDRVEQVHYNAMDPDRVMDNYVLNSIRAKIPLYMLEALYVERGTISQQLKEEVDSVMESYGIEIVSALISDINPGAEITKAMNEIQRLQRLRVAAVDAAETDKLRRVRAAEAECDARRLAGEGLAEQRKAIVAGLMQSIEDMQEEVPGLTADDATNMLLMNQYYDTMQDISMKSSGSVMMLEQSGGLERVAAQLKAGVTQLMR